MPTYKPVTPDHAVSSILNVVLEETSDPVSTTKYRTLLDIDEDIRSVSEKITSLQVKRATFTGQREEMRIEAAKVQLKGIYGM